MLATKEGALEVGGAKLPAVAARAPRRPTLSWMARAKARQWREIVTPGDWLFAFVLASAVCAISAMRPKASAPVLYLLLLCLAMAGLSRRTQREVLWPPEGCLVPVSPGAHYILWIGRAAGLHVLALAAAYLGYGLAQGLPVSSVLLAVLFDLSLLTALTLLAATLRWHLAVVLPVEVRRVVAVLAQVVIPVIGVAVATAGLMLSARYAWSGIMFSDSADAVFKSAYLEMEARVIGATLSSTSGSSLPLESVLALSALLSADRSATVWFYLGRILAAGAIGLLLWRPSKRPEPPFSVVVGRGVLAERVRAVLLRLIPRDLRVPGRLAVSAYSESLRSTIGVSILLLNLAVLALLRGGLDQSKLLSVAEVLGFGVVSFVAVGGWFIADVVGGDRQRLAAIWVLPLGQEAVVRGILNLGLCLYLPVAFAVTMIWAKLAGGTSLESVWFALCLASGLGLLILACGVWRTRWPLHAPNRAAFSAVGISVACAQVAVFGGHGIPIAAALAAAALAAGLYTSNSLLSQRRIPSPFE